MKTSKKMTYQSKKQVLKGQYESIEAFSNNKVEQAKKMLQNVDLSIIHK